MPAHFRCQRFYKTLDKVEFSQTYCTPTHKQVLNLCISWTGIGLISMSTELSVAYITDAQSATIADATTPRRS